MREDDDDDDRSLQRGCGGCSPPGRHRREMYRGDSFIFNVQVFQTDGCTPQDITGWTAWFTGKQTLSAPDSQADIRLGSAFPLFGITFPLPTIGQLQVTVPPQSTVNFPDTPQCLFYDVQVKDLVGNIYTVDRGTIRVEPDVTRAIV